VIHSRAIGHRRRLGATVAEKDRRGG
jgi:hypothetical protein